MEQNLKRIILLIVVVYFLISYFNMINEIELLIVLRANDKKPLTEIRKIIPNHFLLVPGVGAQGGSLQEVVKYGKNDECGLLVNSSRQIIYASSDVDFAEKAREEALKVQQEMAELLK